MMETGTQTITTIHVVLMAVLAVLVVIGLVYGARLKRRRKAGQDALEVRAEEAGVQTSQPDDHGEQPPSRPEPAAEPTPVPPPPPPIADTPAPSPERTPEAAPARDPLADEPIAAAAPLEASPAAEAAPPAASPAVPAQGRATAFADGPVTLLKGLGPKVAARLADLGITTVGQIAALDAADAQALDSQLGTFAGRMARDRWIEQARFLAAGDKAGFEAAFGKL